MNRLPKLLLFAAMALLLFAVVQFVLGLCLAYFGSGRLGFDVLSGTLLAPMVALGVAVVAVIAAAVIGMTRPTPPRPPVLAPTECWHCGYDIRGSAGGVCPECGSRIGGSA